MKNTRRDFLKLSGATIFAVTGSFASVIASGARRAEAHPRLLSGGYGDLLPDPNGVLDLPRGFQYYVFSCEGDPMTGGGIVPGSHDGMATFPGDRGNTFLVRNHEIEPEDVAEDGVIAVPNVSGMTYDPDGVGGTTTLLVDSARKLVFDRVSLAGTITNCAGGRTLWNTWLTCEENTDTLSKPHGYVFEVDPRLGGNPSPIKPMGRFEHEAVSFSSDGRAFLTEDAGEPHGCFYRFTPNQPNSGRGSLHAGGLLEAMKIEGVTNDLSEVQDPDTKLSVRFVRVTNPDPDLDNDEASTREQAQENGATAIPKLEGTWRGPDGNIWFVGSRGDGPNAEDEEDISAGVHAGQIWKYDPYQQTVELVVIFPQGSPFDGPDNVTVGPHGFALACTDGEDDQFLVGITEDGDTFPFAFNHFDDSEFAGATFSDDGQTLFVNIQGQPGLTFAIWGPWARRGRP